MCGYNINKKGTEKEGTDKEGDSIPGILRKDWLKPYLLSTRLCSSNFKMKAFHLSISKISGNSYRDSSRMSYIAL